MKRALMALAASVSLSGEPIQIGGDLELLVDTHLLASLHDVRLVLAKPKAAELVIRFDQPWEGAAGYATVLFDGVSYRLYYRGMSRDAQGGYDSATEVTCYAESRDGIHWFKPELNLHEFSGSRRNNIILGQDIRRISHNFAPYLDLRPGVPTSEKFKALGGVFHDNSESVPGIAKMAVSGGLYRYVSADGVRWQLHSESPIFPGYALDSLNALVWLERENVYAAYLRTWSEGGTPKQPAFRGKRTISRAVSPDFIHWSEPQPVEFGETPLEHLYTNGTHSYFRAPHLLVALPFRFLPERRLHSDQRLRSWGVDSTQFRGLSDVVFMTSRGGDHFDRTFMESFVRPGLDAQAWHARDNAPALGVVPTGPQEMSFYVVQHYTQPDAGLRRFVLRTDGFASAHADYTPGTLETKPLVFKGKQLAINFSTSAAGLLQVSLLDERDQVIAESADLFGDEIRHQVVWRGRDDVGEFAGRVVKLRFRLQDADLYSLQFVP